jgi:hypothetical protein
MEFEEWLSHNPENKLTVAYGAAAKAVTLLSQVGSSAKAIDLVIDNSPGKLGKFLPVANSKIVSESEFRGMSITRAPRFIIFPWNLAGAILPRIREIDAKAEVIVAIPELRRL